MFNKHNTRTKTIVLTSAIAFSLAAGLSACSKSDDEVALSEAEKPRALEKISGYGEYVKENAFEKKEETKEFLDRKISQIDRQLDETEARLEYHKGEFTEELVEEKEDAIKAIKGYKEDLEDIARKVSDSSEEEWQELKKDIAKTYDKTERKIESTWKEITNS